MITGDCVKIFSSDFPVLSDLGGIENGNTAEDDDSIFSILSIQGGDNLPRLK